VTDKLIILIDIDCHAAVYWEATDTNLQLLLDNVHNSVWKNVR